MIESVFQPKSGTYAAVERVQFPLPTNSTNSGALALLTREIIDAFAARTRHFNEQRGLVNCPRDFDITERQEDC